MVQTRVTLSPADILQGTSSVAFPQARNATEGVPYSVTLTTGELNHAIIFPKKGHPLASRPASMKRPEEGHENTKARKHEK